MRLVLASLLLVPFHAAAAQVAPLPADRGTPAAWVSVAGALVDLASFHGGEDGAVWNWGSGVQVRGTLERAIRRDMTVGVSGSYARLPLSVSGGACSGCRGDGTVWQAMGLFRLGGGGGVGFHSALEASAGVSGFTSFTRGSDPLSVPGPLTTPHRSIVPSASVSYGVGYTLNPGLELTFVQELGIFFYGPSAAAPSDASSTPRFQTTRLSLRYALNR